jgi:hypothetical protein
MMTRQLARTVMIAIGMAIVLSFVIRFQMIVLPIKGYFHATEHPPGAGVIMLRSKLPVVLALLGAVALFLRRSWAPYPIYLSTLLSLYHWIVFPLLPMPVLSLRTLNYNLLNFVVAGILLWAHLSLRRKDLDMQVDSSEPTKV